MSFGTSKKIAPDLVMDGRRYQRFEWSIGEGSNPEDAHFELGQELRSWLLNLSSSP